VPLHVLVNNAGVFLVPFDNTQEGFETTVGTNYFGESVACAQLIDSKHHILLQQQPLTCHMHRALLADSPPAGQSEEDCQGHGWGQVGIFPP